MSSTFPSVPSQPPFRSSELDPPRPLRVLVVMNEPASIDANEDTTMTLVDELRHRGHRVELCTHEGLYLGSDGLNVRACTGCSYAVASFDAVLLRTDPAFDVGYLQATLLLEHARDRCVLVNDPRALRDCNEKLYPLRFPQPTPPTIVSAEKSDLLRFLDDHGGRIVVKPTDGCGGRGIFIADATDPNLHAIFESATDHGRRRVIAQRYLAAAATTGDKRIILLDGQPIGAFLRRPARGHARANLHAGGTASPAQLTPKDLQIVDTVGARCRTDGLFLVGLDVIDGWLTEVNVTSPQDSAHTRGSPACTSSNASATGSKRAATARGPADTTDTSQTLSSSPPEKPQPTRVGPTTRTPSHRPQNTRDCYPSSRRTPTEPSPENPAAQQTPHWTHSGSPRRYWRRSSPAAGAHPGTRPRHAAAKGQLVHRFDLEHLVSLREPRLLSGPLVDTLRTARPVHGFRPTASIPAAGRSLMSASGS